MRAMMFIREWQGKERGKNVVMKIFKWFMNPPPSNLVFYLLLVSNIWFAYQVEIQGAIIKNQMVLLDYFVRLAFKG